MIYFVPLRAVLFTPKTFIHLNFIPWPFEWAQRFVQEKYELQPYNGFVGMNKLKYLWSMEKGHRTQAFVSFRIALLDCTGGISVDAAL